MRKTTIALSKRVLHHEWIHGARKQITNNTKENTVLFLHGLLGSGKNLRTPAKKLIERNPHLSVLLLDARGHGASSQKMAGFEPPHTLSNCAKDVIETVQHLDLIGEDHSPIGVVGHSFGGRVALEYLHTLTANSNNQFISPPKTTWLLDTAPTAAHTGVADVLHAVSDVSTPLKSKHHLIQDLTNRQKIHPQIARWMTTNLVRSPCGEGYNFSFDLEVAHQILKDFSKQDFYSLLYKIQDTGVHRNGTRCRINLIRAGRNEAWTDEVLKKLRELQKNFANIHVLPDAGHWVHVDDLDGLLDVLHDSFEESKESA